MGTGFGKSGRVTDTRFEDRGFWDRHGPWRRRIRSWTGPMCARARRIWMFAGMDLSLIHI